mgnify:CR=1 FL=1
MKGLALKYFRLFSEKNIDALFHMFDEEVSLRDWEIKAQGRVNVLTAMRETFESVESIQIDIINIYELTYEKKVIAELEIVIDGNTEESLSVVDIIKFSDEEKILAIKAFKG